MSDIENWDTTAAGNNDASPNGWPENMNRSDVNNSARENMAAVKRFYDDPEFVNPFKADTVTKGSSTTVEIAGVDRTAFFNVNRRVKIIGDTTVLGFVKSVVFTTDTEITVDVDSAAVVPDNTTAIHLAGAASLARAAYGAGIAILEVEVFL